MPLHTHRISRDELLHQLQEQDLIPNFYKLLQQCDSASPIAKQLVASILKYLTALYGVSEQQRNILTTGFEQHFQRLLLTLCQKQFGFKPSLNKIKKLEQNLLANLRTGMHKLSTDDFVLRMISDIFYQQKIYLSLWITAPLDVEMKMTLVSFLNIFNKLTKWKREAESIDVFSCGAKAQDDLAQLCLLQICNNDFAMYFTAAVTKSDENLTSESTLKSYLIILLTVIIYYFFDISIGFSFVTSLGCYLMLALLLTWASHLIPSLFRSNFSARNVPPSYFWQVMQSLQLPIPPIENSEPVTKIARLQKVESVLPVDAASSLYSPQPGGYYPQPSGKALKTTRKKPLPLSGDHFGGLQRTLPIRNNATDIIWKTGGTEERYNAEQYHPHIIQLTSQRMAWVGEHNYIYWNEAMIHQLLGRMDSALYKIFHDLAMIHRVVPHENNQGFIHEGHFIIKQLTSTGSHFRLHFDRTLLATDGRNQLHFPTRLTNN